MPGSLLDATFWLTAAAIGGLLLLSAFFSGAETALTAASRGKLRARADKGSAGAAAALAVKEDDERMIGTLLLGNNVVNILSASLATAALTRVFGASGVALATVVMTVLVLVFGEVLPKTLAITIPEPAAARVAPAVRLLMWLFGPVIRLVQWVVGGVLGLFGVRTEPGRHVLSVHEEIAGAIALGHSAGAMEREDRDRLLGALDLSHRDVSEIMKHRSQIEMVDADRPPAEIVAQVLASPHTRLPVYRGSDENILGVIHAKELLRAMDRLLRAEGDWGALRDLDVLEVAMPPYFIPETTPLDEQMRQFLRRHTHFALVVDEYGALQGLITLEDILEEIVGEITDEFDVREEKAIEPAAAGAYLVDGTLAIRTLNRALDWRLPDAEANTVAGLVIHEARLIPEVGATYDVHGFRFEVVAKDGNRITRLLVRPLPAAPTEP